MDKVILVSDYDAILPKYQTLGSACFDFIYDSAGNGGSITVKPFTTELIPTNVKVVLPQGYALLVFSRSSMPIKKKLIIPNGVGVIDSDYRGEIHVEVFNPTQEDIIIESGERIGQGMIIRLPEYKLETFADSDMYDHLEEDYPTERGTGGFGSTGA